MPEQLQLRDIHLPEPVGWWPPAPGWWLLGLLLIVLVAVTVIMLRRYLHKRRPRLAALQQLQDLQSTAGPEGWQALNRLLKQVAMMHDPEVAACTGSNWVQRLEPDWPDDSVAALHRLARAPYQPASSADQPEFEQLCHAAEQWIRRRL